MACMMCIVAGLMVSLSAPNGSIKKKYTYLRRILLVQEATRTPGKVCSPPGRSTLGPLWDQFGVTLGSVWVSVGDFGSLDGHFAMIVESLWSAFKKHAFSLQILMILYSSGVNCGSLWVTFGSLLAYESDFGATLGSLRHHLWHAKMTLGSLWNHFSYMMVTLWQLWGH